MVVETERTALAMSAINADEAFSRPELTDDALTAAQWANAKFHTTFPGWQLYRRIAAGMTLFDDELDAWVVGGARLLARARKKPVPPAKTGRCYIEARGPWIDQAARDALYAAINGRRPASAREREAQFRVKRDTYLKIYRPILACLIIGLETYRGDLHAEYRRVKLATPENIVNLRWEGADISRSHGLQSGNAVTLAAPDSDTLHAPAMPDVLR